MPRPSLAALAAVASLLGSTPAAANEKNCRRDCHRGAERPIGPTRPPSTRDHPYFPAVELPSTYAEFCEAGCAFFFSELPSNITCKRRCNEEYKYDVTPGYNDLAEVSRYECYDGCDLALMRCQPGYHCDWPSTTGVAAEANWHTHANMTRCDPGKWRDNDYAHVATCKDCPPGRYREEVKGRDLESCAKCPASRYVNVSGSDSLEDCKRCPAGRYSHEQGAQLCHCITHWSCGDAEAWKATPSFKDCNPAAQNCESSSFQVHLRPTSRYHLCRDPEKYKELAAANAFDFELDANDLDDLSCEGFVDNDYNYDMEELNTKRERRETDGRHADSTKPQPLF